MSENLRSSAQLRLDVKRYAKTWPASRLRQKIGRHALHMLTLDDILVEQGEERVLSPSHRRALSVLTLPAPGIRRIRY